MQTDLQFVYLSPARMDRYNHDLCGDDTDETEDSPLIGSFSSYSPQYRRQNSSRFPNQFSDKVGAAMSPNLSSHEVKSFTRPELRKLDVRHFDEDICAFHIRKRDHFSVCRYRRISKCHPLRIQNRSLI